MNEERQNHPGRWILDYVVDSGRVVKPDEIAAAARYMRLLECELLTRAVIESADSPTPREFSVKDIARIFNIPPEKIQEPA
jgi:hypothetical protein